MSEVDQKGAERMQLDLFANPEFDRGASVYVEVIWLVIQGLLFNSWLPGSGWRVRMLRLFGAQIGSGVMIKPYVRVKFPWRLTLGNHVWIGESVWIDNLAQVTVEDHVCISQGAYLCTGSHNWGDVSFGLVSRAITIETGSWVCSKASLAPGTLMKAGAVLGMNSLGKGIIEGDAVHSADGNRKPRMQKLSQS